MQTGEKLAVCPSGAVCSTSVSLAFPQGDDMDAADYAQALFNITSSGLVQVCDPPCHAHGMAHSLMIMSMTVIMGWDRRHDQLMIMITIMVMATLQFRTASGCQTPFCCTDAGRRQP